MFLNSFAFIKSLEGPFFLEINSYRLFEHCGHKIDKINGDRNEDEFKFFEKLDNVNKWIREDNSVFNSYNQAYQDCSKRCKEFSDKSTDLKSI